MLKQIINGRILTPQGWLKGGSVIIDGNKIKAVSNIDLDITVKSIDMRQGFYECVEHNSKNRKKAIDEMSYASKVVAVVGGYIGFESWDDYEIWKNQK